MKSSTLTYITLFIVASALLVRAEEEKIPLDQAPANIQTAIKKIAGPNKILSVEKAHDEDKVEYEVLTEKANGKKMEFIIKSDGRLDSTEEPLTQDQLPGAVAKTVGQTVGDGKIHNLERVTKDGEVTYEVGYKSSKGDKRETVISSNSKLLKNDVDKD